MKNFNDLIVKEEILIRNIKTMNKPIFHIAFGVDSNFAMALGILIFSILKNNPKSLFFFHIFTDYFCEKDVQALKETVQNHSVNTKIYYMNITALKKLPTTALLSTATYYRFIMPDILYGKVKQFLYMDVDILCINQFSQLMEYNLNDNYAGVIKDLNGMAEKARKRNFGFSAMQYFNAGVMYVNVDEWVKNNIAHQAIELSSKNIFRQLDQDILNLLFQNKVCWMDTKYNYIYNLSFMNHVPPSDTILIHFAGNTKPWQLWGQHHFLTILYQKYQKQTPWKNIPIQIPKTYKHARFMAQYYSKHHKKIQSYLWIIKYIYWKIKAKLFK